jgi:hypothetical protein
MGSTAWAGQIWSISNTLSTVNGAKGIEDLGPEIRFVLFGLSRRVKEWNLTPSKAQLAIARQNEPQNILAAVLQPTATGQSLDEFELYCNQAPTAEDPNIVGWWWDNRGNVSHQFVGYPTLSATRGYAFLVLPLHQIFLPFNQLLFSLL